ncbi:MAG TPA: hypothetical protein VM865_01685, partial [Acidobacteriaceae bacterium]|nr:hypothetical protein [Acidobacteriaceae bacterium]
MGPVAVSAGVGKRVLALNAGSSSLKFGLFQVSGDAAETLLAGEAESIGSPASRFSAHDANGKVIRESTQPLGDLAAAAKLVFDQLHEEMASVEAVGHRVVHGGAHVLEHQRLTPEVRAELERAKDLAPLHTPAALALIDAMVERFPALPQIVCLDTAFHRTMPERARRLPLPAEAIEGGVQRYGAHGLSLESAVHLMGPELRSKSVIAHLGNGCSVTAVQDGRSV